MKTKTVFLATAMAIIVWLTATGPAFSHGIKKPQHPPCYKGMTLDREQKAQIHERFMDEFNSKQQLKERGAERGFLPDMITSNSYSEGDNRQINTYDTQGKPLTALYKRMINGAWQDSVLETYTYDGSGRPITYLSQTQANGAWLNSEKYLFTYDGSGNIASNVYQMWENGNWLNMYQDIYTYDGSGNMLTDLSQEYKTGVWENSMLMTSTYDASGNNLTYLGQMWSGTAWDNSEFITYTYDVSGNMLTELMQFWDSGAWSNMFQATHTYNGSGSLLTRFEEFWGGTAWMNSGMLTKTYDASNNMVHQVWQEWMGTQWENFSGADFTYDGSGNCLTRTDLMWNVGVWDNYMKSVFVYTAGLIVGDAYRWSGTSWVTDEFYMTVALNNNGNVITFYVGLAYHVEVTYSDYLTGVKAPGASMTSLLNVYPNPARESFAIDGDIKESGRASIILYDLSGNQVALIWEGNMDAGRMPVVFDTRSIPSGLYVVELKTENRSVRKKITIVD